MLHNLKSNKTRKVVHPSGWAIFVLLDEIGFKSPFAFSSHLICDFSHQPIVKNFDIIAVVEARHESGSLRQNKTLQSNRLAKCRKFQRAMELGIALVMNETEDGVARAVVRGITRWVIKAALIAFAGYWLVNGGLFIMGLCEADSDLQKGAYTTEVIAKPSSVEHSGDSVA